MSVAEVKLWGRTIGAVSWDSKGEYANFEYDKAFVKSNIQIAPLTMPLSDEIYAFPSLNEETFSGLPGLLSDSLPDKFGNALINRWLETQGRRIDSFNPVERLCYVGARGMGALEYLPAIKFGFKKSKKLDVDALVKLAGDVISNRESLKTSFTSEEREEAMRDILSVGTSAGGARAKAIIAWNKTTNEVRSGQINHDKGFGYWLLKFDGVRGNKDKELEDPEGYGLIEYAYYQMALAAGIEMNKCEILTENHRHHFMAKRFDRTENGEKIHMLSLCAMKHYDFNMAGAHSYEQALHTIRQLGMSMTSIEEQFRRMVFNILSRNQDDHVKNISFLMDKAGKWSLSPAYDLTYSYNPDGMWTSQHQMSVNGKRDNFDLEDLIGCARSISMQKNRALEIVDQVQTAVSRWTEIAEKLKIPAQTIKQIQTAHRKLLF